MKIALVGSQSEKKIAAVRRAFGQSAQIIPLNAPSGVNEQPIGDETLRGAQNRIAFIKAACGDADFYISIENGLFPENGKYIDRALVLIDTKSGQCVTAYSDGVEFPKEYVLQTRDRPGGFAQWTVGKTMQEAGIVRDHADPHRDLDPQGRSRVEFLYQAAQNAAAALKL